MTGKIAMFLTVAGVALGQKAQFEVASIRPAKQDNSHGINSESGFLRTHNAELKRLIAFAYDVDIGQIFGGPNWVASDGWDINAKIPEEIAKNRTRDQLREMVRALLADRFQLQVHREQRQVSGFELVVGKKGSKMEPGKPDQQGSHMNTNNTHMKAENVTMETFARNLTRDTGRLVVDKTGLKGGFNFELDWMPERADASNDDRPSIFTAVQEQLGLRLESAKVDVMAVVIDRAERPEEN